MAEADDSFSLYEEWKELLVYRDAHGEYTFDCGWGVTPGEVYIPTREVWLARAPAGLRDRYDLIVERIRTRTGYTIQFVGRP
jgi:hypothetical protein